MDHIESVAGYSCKPVILDEINFSQRGFARSALKLSASHVALLLSACALIANFLFWVVDVRV